MSDSNYVLRLDSHLLDIARLAATLPAPTLGTDGAAMPALNGNYRPRRIALQFSGGAGATINAPVQVHAWDGFAWYSVGIINGGASIDAATGFEVEIPWSGGLRIAVSAASITNGPVDVFAIPLEVL